MSGGDVLAWALMTAVLGALVFVSVLLHRAERIFAEAVDAGMLRPAPSRPNYDQSPALSAARRGAAADLSHGPPVTLPRGVADYAEHLLTRLLASDHPVVGDFDGLKAAGCRQALSDAIERSDSKRSDR